MQNLFRNSVILICSILIYSIFTITPASAHGVGGLEPSKTEAEVTSIEPKTTEFKAESIENGRRFEITRLGAKELIVLGIESEPYIRMNEEGVFLNKKSATRIINQSSSSTKSIDELKDEFSVTSSDPDAKPSWYKVSSSDTYAFLDHRTHYMGSVPEGVSDLGSNQLDVKVGNQIHVITISFHAKQTTFPYLSILLLFGICIGIAIFALRNKNGFKKIISRRICAIFLAIIAVSETLHIVGYMKFAQQSFASELSGAFYGILLIALAIASLLKILNKKARQRSWNTTVRAHAPLLSITGFVGLSAGAIIEYQALIYPYPATSLSPFVTRLLIICVGSLSTAILMLGIGDIKQSEHNEEPMKDVSDLSPSN